MTLFFAVDLLTDYAVLLILALGLHIVMLSGQISLGHAGIVGVGAYATAILVVKLGVPFLISIPLCGLVGALAGLFVSLVLAQRLKGIYLAIGTFALGEAIIALLLNIEYVGGAIGFPGIPHLSDWRVVLPIAAALLFLTHRFETSRFGVMFRAVRDNETVAATIGIDVTAMKTMAWMLGCFVTALGGALYAHRAGVIAPPEFGFLFSVQVLLAPVIGGSQSFRGTVLGAAVVYFLPWAVQITQPEDRLMIYGAVFVLMMIFRPQGLLGKTT